MQFERAQICNRILQSRLGEGGRSILLVIDMQIMIRIRKLPHYFKDFFEKQLATQIAVF